MIRVKYHRMYAHTLNSEFGVRLVILHWLLLPLLAYPSSHQALIEFGLHQMPSDNTRRYHAISKWKSIKNPPWNPEYDITIWQSLALNWHTRALFFFFYLFLLRWMPVILFLTMIHLPLALVNIFEKQQKKERIKRYQRRCGILFDIFFSSYLLLSHTQRFRVFVCVFFNKRPQREHTLPECT